MALHSPEMLSWLRDPQRMQTVVIDSTFGMAANCKVITYCLLGFVPETLSSLPLAFCLDIALVPAGNAAADAEPGDGSGARTKLQRPGRQPAAAAGATAPAAAGAGAARQGHAGGKGAKPAAAPAAAAGETTPAIFLRYLRERRGAAPWQVALSDADGAQINALLGEAKVYAADWQQRYLQPLAALHERLLPRRQQRASGSAPGQAPPAGHAEGGPDRAAADPPPPVDLGNAISAARDYLVKAGSTWRTAALRAPAESVQMPYDHPLVRDALELLRRFLRPDVVTALEGGSLGGVPAVVAMAAALLEDIAIALRAVADADNWTKYVKACKASLWQRYVAVARVDSPLHTLLQYVAGRRVIVCWYHFMKAVSTMARSKGVRVLSCRPDPRLSLPRTA